MGLPRILIADHEIESRELLIDCLKHEGSVVIGVCDGEEALTTVNSRDIDVLIADITIPKLDGLALLSKVKKEKPGIAVLMMTGRASVSTAIKAMKLGAEEYMTKPLNVDELKELLNTISEKNRYKFRHSETNDFHNETGGFHGIIGKSEPLQKVFQLIKKVADTDSTVMICGESGTGKELVARAIHYNSYRNNKPLVPVNCGAIPEELLESELFGHEKGAFTGAHKSRTGRFELADGGTIFLDEIGDMSPNLQVKILRVLQEHEFERVGGVKPVKVDIRVIAATHRDLEKAVADEKFREDLYYRLNVIPIVVPPLRERREDIPLLVTLFIDRFNKEKGQKITSISDDVLECFMTYDWPGNVRELQNMVERLVILKGTGNLAVDDLPDKLLMGKNREWPQLKLPEEGASFSTIVTDFEKQLILHALTKTKGVKNRAAKLLNMNRTTLVEKMKKLQIEYKE